jgi:hypothetical protein
LIDEEHKEEREQILRSRIQKEKIQKSSPNIPPVPQFEKTLNRYSTTNFRQMLVITHSSTYRILELKKKEIIEFIAVC